jgi:hypothetical protein
MTVAHSPVPRPLSEERVAAELCTADDKLMATHVRGRYSSFVVPGRPFYQPHPQGTECEENASLAGFDIPTMLSKNTARMGDEGKAVRRGGAGFAV